MAGRAKPDTGKRRKLEADLDKALAQTFPASDPFSVGNSTGTEPPTRPVDRQVSAPGPSRSPGPTAPRRRRKASN